MVGNSSHRFAVLILAAGRSRRMGRPKALLPWGGRVVLAHLREVWSLAGAVQVVPVLDPSLGVVVEAAGGETIFNERAAEGMFSSLQAAASWPGWVPGLDHVAVVLVDQPQFPGEAVSELSGLAARHPGHICQPSHAGRRAHPVWLPWMVFAGIKESPAADLREHLAISGASRVMLPVEQAWWLEDLDTWEAYTAMYQRVFGGVPGVS